MGGEVLLETAAHDPRLRAVVADGAARPVDAQAANDSPVVEEGVQSLALGMVRGISGMRPAPSLNALMPRIAPRPVLLIGSGGDPTELPTIRVYRDRGGATTELWELPDTPHTGGLREHPAEYERRTTRFLDAALQDRAQPAAVTADGG